MASLNEIESNKQHAEYKRLSDHIDAGRRVQRAVGLLFAVREQPTYEWLRDELKEYSKRSGVTFDMSVSLASGRFVSVYSVDKKCTTNASTTLRAELKKKYGGWETVEELLSDPVVPPQKRAEAKIAFPPGRVLDVLVF